MKNQILSDSDKNYIKKTILDAGRILTRYFGKKFTVKKKVDSSIVTEADKQSEELLIKKLSKRFKNSSFLCEESGLQNGKSGIKWIIDPLDGTTNFSRGIGRFCISVGMEIDDMLALGAIYNPVSADFFWAEENVGSFLNGNRVKVSKIAKLSDSILGTGDSHKEFLRELEFKTLKILYRRAFTIRKTGSVAMDLADLSCGRIDGFFHKGVNPWDVAAGILLVTEAGGRVTNFVSDKYNIMESEIIATNGTEIHSEIQNAVYLEIYG